MKGSIPNIKWLNQGAAITTLFLAYLSYVSSYQIVLIAAIGLPVSYLFQMFNNPKEQHDKGAHIALAVPTCAVMWPVILLVLLAGRPWKDPKWINRDSIE